MSVVGGMLMPSGGATGARRLGVRVLASLFAAGATLVLLALVLPHPPRADQLGLSLIAAGAFAVAALLLWQGERLPTWALALVLALSTTLVTGVAYFAGEAPSPFVFFYLWVLLYCAYFFARPVALAELAYLGIAFGVLLTLRTPSHDAIAWWLVGMGTMLVGAIVIRIMRDHVEALIARLYETARTDPLTRLPNRRAFREQLDLEIERARRDETTVTLLVGDVDRFKDVNDRAGHQVGDAVLREIGALLCDGIRQIDLAARLGGDEFALLLPNTPTEGALLVAERLHGLLRSAFAEATVPVTISFGLAGYPSHAATAASLVRAADEALFAAKQSGADRTVVHSPALRELVGEAIPGHDVEAERFLAVVLDLAEAVDVRFSGTARHSETVGRYAEMMARELGLPEHRVERVRLAGLLHDVGKVGVPDAILSKRGRLTDEERAKIRLHPGLGAQILEHPSLADVQAWVGAHHERPDGEGYPRGLHDAELPLEPRIVAVADAYEAMTSDRSYRDAIGHERARTELERCTGTQFDARVVAALLAVLDREAQRAETLLGGGGAPA